MDEPAAESQFSHYSLKYLWSVLVRHFKDLQGILQHFLLLLTGMSTLLLSNKVIFLNELIVIEFTYSCSEVVATHLKVSFT